MNLTNINSTRWLHRRDNGYLMIFNVVRSYLAMKARKTKVFIMRPYHERISKVESNTQLGT